MVQHYITEDNTRVVCVVPDSPSLVDDFRALLADISGDNSSAQVSLGLLLPPPIFQFVIPPPPASSVVNILQRRSCPVLAVVSKMDDGVDARRIRLVQGG